MTPRAIAAALRAQAQTLLVTADAIEATATAPVDSDRWVDVCQHSPLPKRATLAAARTGAIEGAAKQGRKWVARASAVDAWLTRQTSEPSEAPTALARWRLCSRRGA